MMKWATPYISIKKFLQKLLGVMQDRINKHNYMK